jgi:perosamine synthetase
VIPYGRQSITEQDLAAVADVLTSDYLTTGPRVDAFERAFAAWCGARCGVAVNSGTAALHCAMRALGVGPGDEVVVPPITFAATANAVVYEGATPVFADVRADNLLIDPDQVARRITPRTRAVVAVDYAGQPCDYDALSALCAERGLALVADACHAPGAEWNGRRVGTLARLNAFSFHPVKHMTTGEGGMVLTDDEALAAHMRRFRNHGIDSDARAREARGSWFYEMVELGYNYRVTDIQCALGLAQLARLDAFLARRRAIAARYDAAFAGVDGFEPLATDPRARHAYHLYVVRLTGEQDRGALFALLRERGVGVNVHYVPVHMHPYYRQKFGTGPGDCPVAEAAYERILTLPLYPGMSDRDVTTVIEIMKDLAA